MKSGDGAARPRQREEQNTSLNAWRFGCGINRSFIFKGIELLGTLRLILQRQMCIRNFSHRTTTATSNVCKVLFRDFLERDKISSIDTLKVNIIWIKEMVGALNNSFSSP